MYTINKNNIAIDSNNRYKLFKLQFKQKSFKNEKTFNPTVKYTNFHNP